MSAAAPASPLDDPRHFLHRIDVVRGRALLLQVEAAELAAASFLDERLAQAGRQGGWVPLASLPQRDAQASPRCWIFHVGHCGSTLLARLLDCWPGVLCLREPLVLRELAALEQERDSATARVDPQQMPALRRRALGMLGRPFSPGQRIAVKATSSCNALLVPLLDELPAMRALALWMPLEAYLATVLKSPDARGDVLAFAPARLRSLHAALGEDALRLYELDEAGIAAMGWLAELQRFDSVGDPRLIDMDFHELLDDPAAALRRVATHFGLDAGEEALARALASPVRGRYAKAPDHAYGPEDRAHDLALSRRRFGAEIDAGLAFAEDLVARHPALQSLAPKLR